MSAKNLDNHNRWRNKTVAFRVFPEEEQIETTVRLSGLTKQDYIIRRLMVMWWYRPILGATRPCGRNWPLC